MIHRETLDLADYRRRVADIYARVRRTGLGPESHRSWIEERDALFRSHAQSALPVRERADFTGLDYWEYDPAFRTIGTLSEAEEHRFELPHSGSGTTPFIRVARVTVDLAGSQQHLDLYRLDAYGDGLFLPFRDLTNGGETYGSGRYLLDTAKGADLGATDAGLLLDFNFSYHPSCVHSGRWSCPLPPPGNRLDAPITAGERLPATPTSR